MQQLKVKLLELGKTRTKNASRDMFNFYVVLLIVTQQGYHVQAKTQSPIITKSTKIEGPSENMGFNWKAVWRFQMKKKNRNIIPDLSKKTQWNTRTLKASIEQGPRKQ